MTSELENKKIADLLLPNIIKKTGDYISKYPPRNLPEDAKVTRFGPSPTGFLHIGGIYTALISERIAHQSDGVFFLRIEDTDKTREVSNGTAQIINALKEFGLSTDEGPQSESICLNSGKYGPYKQSERVDIYLTFAKHLLEKGLAYPCFCTKDELETLRKEQESNKIRPGYYGKWARHRDAGLKEIEDNLKNNIPFVIRLKSDGVEENSFVFSDLAKGKINVTENNNDIVLIKADSYPTYHFAHVVDDFLMGVTHVIRGDEWLSSLPIHLQIFKFLGIKAPFYAHISPILKLENGSKRKLSKRKDPESSVDFYFEKGYPVDSIIEYLLNIANSGFEDWRRGNPYFSNMEFPVKLEKISKSGALFDLNKLDNISKEVISKMTAEEVFEKTLTWATSHNKNFANILTENRDFCLQIFSIERNDKKPRKDFASWSEIEESISYFFDSKFEQVKVNSNLFPEHLTDTDIQEIVDSYSNVYQEENNRDDWFEKIKTLSESLGYASNIKDFKTSPDSYKGHVGDVAMVLRVMVTGKTQTPDLYEIMNVLGKERVLKRLKF